MLGVGGAHQTLARDPAPAVGGSDLELARTSGAGGGRQLARPQVVAPARLRQRPPAVAAPLFLLGAAGGIGRVGGEAALQGDPGALAVMPVGASRAVRAVPPSRLHNGPRPASPDVHGQRHRRADHRRAGLRAHLPLRRLAGGAEDEAPVVGGEGPLGPAVRAAVAHGRVRHAAVVRLARPPAAAGGDVDDVGVLPGAAPAVLLAKVRDPHRVRVRRHRHRARVGLDQPEQRLAVGHRRQRDVGQQHQHPVPRHAGEVVADEVQHPLAEPAPVAGHAAAVLLGAVELDVVQDHEVRRPPVEGVGGGPEVTSEGLVGPAVAAGVAVLVVVAEHHPPRHADPRQAVGQVAEQPQAVEDQVAEHHPELAVEVQALVDDVVVHVADLTPVARLGVAEEEGAELVRFLLRGQREVDRGRQGPGRGDAEVARGRRAFWPVQVVVPGRGVVSQRHHPAARLDHEQLGGAVDRQLPAAADVGGGDLAAVRDPLPRQAGLAVVAPAVAVEVVEDRAAGGLGGRAGVGGGPPGEEGEQGEEEAHRGGRTGWRRIRAAPAPAPPSACPRRRRRRSRSASRGSAGPRPSS